MIVSILHCLSSHSLFFNYFPTQRLLVSLIHVAQVLVTILSQVNTDVFAMMNTLEMTVKKVAVLLI